MQLQTSVLCYEPVEELLEASDDFDNVEAVCGNALDFGRRASDESFDLVFTKDTAHHFPPETLDQVHDGFCRKLAPGGRYSMIVRQPPRDASIPVGSIARAKWDQAYTPLSDLLDSMRQVDDWQEVEVTRWQFPVETSVQEWIDGVRNKDSWSIFSALDADELAATITELEEQFAGAETFEFVHQYDVAVFERPT